MRGLLYKLYGCCSLLLVVLVLASGTTQAAPVAQPLQQTDTLLKDLDVVLLIDESGSAWGTTDKEYPEGAQGERLPYRIRAAKAIVNLLSVEPTAPTHQIAVYAFGTDVREVVPMQRIGDQAEIINQRIEDEHHRNGNLKFTDTAQAFEKAYQVLRDEYQIFSEAYKGSNRRPVVVMITDGRPETAEANKIGGDKTPQAERYPEYMQRNTDAIHSFDNVDPGKGCTGSDADASPVFVLGVDKEATGALQGDTRYVGPEYESYWRQELGTHFIPVADFAQLSGDVSYLVSQLLCAGGGQPSVPQPLPAESQFDVKDNYASVIFTILRADPNATATITTPDGTMLDPQKKTPGVKQAQSSTDQSWSINKSEFSPDGKNWSGPWVVKVSNGTGSVQFSFTTISLPNTFKLNLTQPAPDLVLHPAGKPLDLVGQVVDATGKPYTQPTNRFDLEYIRTASSGTNDQPVSQAMAPVGTDGKYQYRIERPKPGQYTLNMRAEVATDVTANLQPARTISVLKLPWITLSTPKAGTPLYAQSPFTVAVSARSMGEHDEQPQPLDSVVARRAKINAVLRRPNNGDDISQTELVLQDNGVGSNYEGTLPAPGSAESYELAVTLSYPLNDKTFEDLLVTSLVFQPGAAPVDATPTPTPLPPTSTPLPPTPTPVVIEPPADPPAGIPGWMLPAGLVTLLGAGGIGWYMLAQQGYPLSGWVDNDSGVPTYLRGRRQKIGLMDDMGMKQAEVQLSMIQGVNGPQAQATITRIQPNQKLMIDGVEQAVGNTVALNDGSEFVIGNRTTRYSQGT